MSYPKSMQYAVNRLSGYSKQNTLLRPMSQSTAAPGDVVIFELPANSIVDLRTFTTYFSASTSAVGGSNAAVILPKGSEALIDAIQVECNGTMIDSGFLGYNNLHKFYMDYFCGPDKNSTMRSLLQHGDLSTLGYTTVANANTPTQAFSIVKPGSASVTTQSNIPLVWNSFIGFLSAKCPIIDTSILGQVRVLIRLAPASVLVAGGDTLPSTVSYSISNLFATIDIIAMQDGLYYQMVQERLAQAPLEVLFDRHYVFQNGSTGAAQTTRWAVNSQSVDWVIGTHYDNISRSNANALDTRANTSSFFKRSGAEVDTSLFFFNGVQYPGYVPNNTNGTVLTSTLQNLNVIQDLVSGADAGLNSYTNWRNSYYGHVHRFNHLPAGDDDSRLISGLTTNGQNAQGYYTTTGTAGASNTYWPQVWVKTTATLAIGPNRTWEVRQ